MNKDKLNWSLKLEKACQENKVMKRHSLQSASLAYNFRKRINKDKLNWSLKLEKACQENKEMKRHCLQSASLAYNFR